MQAAKIKIGETYAYKRGNELVRYSVEEITTTKSHSNTETVLTGVILEDYKPGEPRSKMHLSPSDLVGPYEEQAALVERKRLEDEARNRKSEERKAKAKADVLMLYRFVRVKPATDNPKAFKYDRMFRVGYGETVDISSRGCEAIIKRVRELETKSIQENVPFYHDKQEDAQ